MYWKIDLLNKSRAITGNFSSALLTILRERIIQRRLRKFSNRTVFYCCKPVLFTKIACYHVHCTRFWFGITQTLIEFRSTIFSIISLRKSFQVIFFHQRDGTSWFVEQDIKIFTVLETCQVNLNKVMQLKEKYVALQNIWHSHFFFFYTKLNFFK